MIRGCNAIVTGARSGIGRNTVLAFAQNKANTIWACARKKDDAFEADMQEIANQYNTEIIPIYMDIRDIDQVKAAVKDISDQKKTVDILVNAAGVADESTSFMMTTPDKMKMVFEANFWGATYLTQYVSRLMMRKNHGSIVFVSSVAALEGEPAQYEYAASKAAIHGAVRQLSKELSRYNIRVNAVAPGIIDTQMSSGIENSLKEKVLSGVTMGRMGTPAEVANVITFMASDMSSYMTGQIIRVDGGM